MTTLTPDDLVEYVKEKETLSRNEKNDKTLNNPMSSISTKHTLLKQTLKSKSTSSLVSSPSSTICKSKSNFFKTQCKMNNIKLPKLKIRSSSSLNIKEVRHIISRLIHDGKTVITGANMSFIQNRFNYPYLSAEAKKLYDFLSIRSNSFYKGIIKRT